MGTGPTNAYRIHWVLPPVGVWWSIIPRAAKESVVKKFTDSGTISFSFFFFFSVTSTRNSEGIKLSVYLSTHLFIYVSCLFII